MLLRGVLGWQGHTKAFLTDHAERELVQQLNAFVGAHAVTIQRWVRVWLPRRRARRAQRERKAKEDEERRVKEEKERKEREEDERRERERQQEESKRVKQEEEKRRKEQGYQIQENEKLRR